MAVRYLVVKVTTWDDNLPDDDDQISVAASAGITRYTVPNPRAKKPQNVVAFKGAEVLAVEENLPQALTR